MRSGSRRREDDRFEALAKAGLGLLLLAALAIGGLGGFQSALIGLIVLGVGLVVVGGAAWLVARSRLVSSKKAGLLLILSALVLFFFWTVLRAPPQWSERQFRVVSVKEPPARTTADYSFDDSGPKRSNRTYAVSITKEWPTVSQAKQGASRSLSLYFNPANPAQVSEQHVAGWLLTKATPGPAQVVETGPSIVQIQAGTLFDLKRLEIKAGPSASYRTGQNVSVWINPINNSEYSLVPRATVGGQRWEVLVGTAIALVGGIICLCLRREWREPASIMVPPLIAVAPQLSAEEALQAIDWYQFEKICARLLELDGWQLERRGGANPDGGADLVARRAGDIAVVQCKHWKNYLITPKVLRELLGTKVSRSFAANRCILYSLSDCTSAAQEFARENNVEVFSRREIARQIDRHGLDQFKELNRPGEKCCPRCDAPMVLRAKYGFWGCTRYPACTGKIEVSGEPAHGA